MSSGLRKPDSQVPSQMFTGRLFQMTGAEYENDCSLSTPVCMAFALKVIKNRFQQELH